jgi:histidyl-tRNA synthetase
VLGSLEDMIGADVMKAHVKFDPTIARGLDYYTGTVVETVLSDAPQLGSICSGGRYDNLAESLSARSLPGVGISIGLSRLATWLMGQPAFAEGPATPARVVVTCQDPECLPYYTQVAAALRAAGHNVEQVLAPQSLGTQLKNAAKRGIIHAVMANAEEAAAATLQVKNLHSGAQQGPLVFSALLDNLAS